VKHYKWPFPRKKLGVFAHWNYIFANRTYTDHSASAKKWSSIISLSHKWQFETMSQVAFQAYLLLEEVKPLDKILMRQKYDFPRKMIHKAYLEICTRHQPLTVEEGEKIGLEMLARIALTREEIKDCHSLSKASIDAVTNNLVELEPSRRYY
jgi:hypothetical protein